MAGVAIDLIADWCCSAATSLMTSLMIACRLTGVVGTAALASLKGKRLPAAEIASAGAS